MLSVVRERCKEIFKYTVDLRDEESDSEQEEDEEPCAVGAPLSLDRPRATKELNSCPNRQGRFDQASG